MDAQVVNDLHQFLDRLEKRNHDFEINASNDDSTVPQIRLFKIRTKYWQKIVLFNNDNEFPLWKNQIAIGDIVVKKMPPPATSCLKRQIN